jgi:DNA mismatch repair protein MutS2
MPFTSGDHVLIASLGKAIVREVRRGGRYLVDIKGRAMVVDEAQLEPLDTRTPKRNPTVVRTASADPEAPRRADVSASIDLHGMTTDEAVSALNAFLNDAMVAGHDELRVIHGRSGGRIKSAVHAHLKKIAAVRYRLDPRNPGVTIVTIR